MKKSVPNSLDHLHASLLRITKFHMAFGLLFSVQTIIFHASKVITPELLLRRWIATAILVSVSIIAWLIARSRPRSTVAYGSLVGIIIAIDVAFAAFNVYTQRGYASKSVFLFVLPLLVAAVMRSKSLLLATAGVCTAVYSSTVVLYFVNNFNEGYMSEMYAEIGLYGGLFFIIALLLWSVTPKSQLGK